MDADSSIAEPAIKKLRLQFRRARRNLPPAAQLEHAEAAARALVNAGVLLKAQCCGLYFAQPADGELDTLPLLSRLWSMSKIVGCPVIDTSQGMDFYQVKPTTRLVVNRYGIPEPGTRGRDAGRFLDPLSLSVLFMPLVAFDDHGNRLGMGAGYYDRYIGRQPAGLRPLLVGLAHETQRSSADLPARCWDVGLDAVVTEAGWQAFSARAKVR